METRSAWRARYFVGLAFCASCPTASAWQLDYALTFGAEYSDNVARTGGVAVSDTILRPSINFDLTEQGEQIQAAFVGTASYDYYTDDSFDDELRSDIGARLNWVLLPERLSWVFEDFLAEEPIDVRIANRPSNRQRTNLFTTGPTLKFRFSPAMSARVDLRYADTYAEETESFNGRRAIFAGAIERQLGPAARLGGNLEFQDARFDDDSALATDFERWAMFGRYALTTTRYTLESDLGWSKVDFASGEDTDGALFRLGLRWDYDPSWSLGVAAARQLGDAAGDFALLAPTTQSLSAPVSVGRSFNVAVTSDVFTEQRLTADLVRRGERLTWSLSGFWRKQSFERAELFDQNGRGVFASVDYALTALSSVGLFAGRSWQEFGEVAQDDRELDVGLRFRTQILRELAFNAELTRADRKSDLAANDFDETRAYVGVIWSRR
jgi:hypothetical protein